MKTYKHLCTRKYKKKHIRTDVYKHKNTHPYKHTYTDRMQMFLWNNIFLSLGFDVKDHFKDFGGDYAAYTAPVSGAGGGGCYVDHGGGYDGGGGRL